MEAVFTANVYTKNPSAFRLRSWEPRFAVVTPALIQIHANSSSPAPLRVFPIAGGVVVSSAAPAAAKNKHYFEIRVSRRDWLRSGHGFPDDHSAVLEPDAVVVPLKATSAEGLREFLSVLQSSTLVASVDGTPSLAGSSFSPSHRSPAAGSSPFGRRHTSTSYASSSGRRGSPHRSPSHHSSPVSHAPPAARASHPRPEHHGALPNGTPQHEVIHHHQSAQSDSGGAWADDYPYPSESEMQQALASQEAFTPPPPASPPASPTTRPEPEPEAEPEPEPEPEPQPRPLADSVVSTYDDGAQPLRADGSPRVPPPRSGQVAISGRRTPPHLRQNGPAPVRRQLALGGPVNGASSVSVGTGGADNSPAEFGNADPRSASPASLGAPHHPAGQSYHASPDEDHSSSHATESPGVADLPGDLRRDSENAGPYASEDGTAFDDPPTPPPSAAPSMSAPGVSNASSPDLLSPPDALLAGRLSGGGLSGGGLSGSSAAFLAAMERRHRAMNARMNRSHPQTPTTDSPVDAGRSPSSRHTSKAQSTREAAPAGAASGPPSPSVDSNQQRTPVRVVSDTQPLPRMAVEMDLAPPPWSDVNQRVQFLVREREALASLLRHADGVERGGGAFARPSAVSNIPALIDSALQRLDTSMLAPRPTGRDVSLSSATVSLLTELASASKSSSVLSDEMKDLIAERVTRVKQANDALLLSFDTGNGGQDETSRGTDREEGQSSSGHTPPVPTISTSGISESVRGLDRLAEQLSPGSEFRHRGPLPGSGSTASGSTGREPPGPPLRAPPRVPPRLTSTALSPRSPRSTSSPIRRGWDVDPDSHRSPVVSPLLDGIMPSSPRGSLGVHTPQAKPLQQQQQEQASPSLNASLHVPGPRRRPPPPPPPSRPSRQGSHEHQQTPPSPERAVHSSGMLRSSGHSEGSPALRPNSSVVDTDVFRALMAELDSPAPGSSLAVAALSPPTSQTPLSRASVQATASLPLAPGSPRTGGFVYHPATGIGTPSVTAATPSPAGPSGSLEVDPTYAASSDHGPYSVSVPGSAHSPLPSSFEEDPVAARRLGVSGKSASFRRGPVPEPLHLSPVHAGLPSETPQLSVGPSEGDPSPGGVSPSQLDAPTGGPAVSHAAMDERPRHSAPVPTPHPVGSPFRASAASTSDHVVRPLDEAPNVFGVGRHVKLMSTGALGTVRFAGETKFKSGFWVGVELDGGATGRNDGSVDGVRYFWCKTPGMHGLFIRPWRVLVLPSDMGGASVTVGAPPTGAGMYVSNGTPASNGSPPKRLAGASDARSGSPEGSPPVGVLGAPPDSIGRPLSAAELQRVDPRVVTWLGALSLRQYLRAFYDDAASGTGVAAASSTTSPPARAPLAPNQRKQLVLSLDYFYRLKVRDMVRIGVIQKDMPLLQTAVRTLRQTTDILGPPATPGPASEAVGVTPQTRFDGSDAPDATTATGGENGSEGVRDAESRDDRQKLDGAGRGSGNPARSPSSSVARESTQDPLASGSRPETNLGSPLRQSPALTSSRSPSQPPSQSPPGLNSMHIAAERGGTPEGMDSAPLQTPPPDALAASHESPHPAPSASPLALLDTPSSFAAGGESAAAATATAPAPAKSDSGSVQAPASPAQPLRGQPETTSNNSSAPGTLPSSSLSPARRRRASTASQRRGAAGTSSPLSRRVGGGGRLPRRSKLQPFVSAGTPAGSSGAEAPSGTTTKGQPAARRPRARSGAEAAAAAVAARAAHGADVAMFDESAAFARPTKAVGHSGSGKNRASPPSDDAHSPSTIRPPLSGADAGAGACDGGGTAGETTSSPSRSPARSPTRSPTRSPPPQSHDASPAVSLSSHTKTSPPVSSQGDGMSAGGDIGFKAEGVTLGPHGARATSVVTGVSEDGLLEMPPGFQEQLDRAMAKPANVKVPPEVLEKILGPPPAPLSDDEAEDDGDNDGRGAGDRAGDGGIHSTDDVRTSGSGGSNGSHGPGGAGGAGRGPLSSASGLPSSVFESFVPSESDVSTSEASTRYLKTSVTFLPVAVDNNTLQPVFSAARLAIDKPHESAAGSLISDSATLAASGSPSKTFTGLRGAGSPLPTGSLREGAAGFAGRGRQGLGGAVSPNSASPLSRFKALASALDPPQHADFAAGHSPQLPIPGLSTVVSIQEALRRCDSPSSASASEAGPPAPVAAPCVSDVVGDWLTALGCFHLSQVFADCGILTLHDVKNLNEDNLHVMKIPESDIYVLVDAIAALQRYQPLEAASSASMPAHGSGSNNMASRTSASAPQHVTRTSLSGSPAPKPSRIPVRRPRGNGRPAHGGHGSSARGTSAPIVSSPPSASMQQLLSNVRAQVSGSPHGRGGKGAVAFGGTPAGGKAGTVSDARAAWLAAQSRRRTQELGGDAKSRLLGHTQASLRRVQETSRPSRKLQTQFDGHELGSSSSSSPNRTKSPRPFVP